MKIFPKEKESLEEKEEITIIIDDLSYLINIFGDRQVFGFIQELRNRGKKCGVTKRSNEKKYLSSLILRKSTELFHPSNNLSSKVYVGVDTYLKTSETENTTAIACPFDCLLYEIVDGVVDIIPLSSGYYKDATSHGRIIFTECYSLLENKNGFSNDSKKGISDPFIISFCYTEHGVQLKMLRGNV